MRSKGILSVLSVFFVLFTVNAYACLFSMNLPASESMPMDSSVPSSHDASLPCPGVPCEAIPSPVQGGGDCLLSSTASALKALQISHQEPSAPVWVLDFVAPAMPLGVYRSLSPDGPPRPLFSVSLLRLHAALLL